MEGIVIFMYNQQLGERRDAWLDKLKLGLLPLFRNSLEVLFQTFHSCLSDLCDSSGFVGQPVMGEMAKIETETAVGAVVTHVTDLFAQVCKVLGLFGSLDKRLIASFAAAVTAKDLSISIYLGHFPQFGG